MRVAALFVLLPSLSLAATYHVAPGGLDSNDGSTGAPWQTLQHAADTVMAGDTVLVDPGDYTGFDLRTGGLQAMPIVFQGRTGVRIVAQNAITPDGVNVEGVSWVVIEGFESSAMPRAGFRAATCSHVTFRGNRADQNGSWGIFTGFCDDLLIEGNECSRSVAEHGIYVSNSGDRSVIRGNRIWGNYGSGIHMNGDLSMGGDGIISGALVEANVIWDNGAGGGSGIGCDGVQDSTFRNNLLYENHASGLSLYQFDAAAPSTNNTVINNTIVNASNGRWCINVKNASTGLTLRNNILYNLHPFHGSAVVMADSLAGLVSDHNAVMDRFTTDDGISVLTLVQWQAQTGQDSTSLLSTAAELFVSGTDYHLSAASPAIDRGSAVLAPIMDLEGTFRPQGDAIDIGAYEACEGGGCVAVPDAGIDAGSGSDGGVPDGGTASLRPCGCSGTGSMSWFGAVVLMLLLVARRLAT